MNYIASLPRENNKRIFLEIWSLNQFKGSNVFFEISAVVAVGDIESSRNGFHCSSFSSSCTTTLVSQKNALFVMVCLQEDRRQVQSLLQGKELSCEERDPDKYQG